jgi:endonuclease/exonuclease/phosphatase family metal-dependent hydrolase
MSPVNDQEPTVLKVVVWNVQADQRTPERTARIRARIAALKADIVCLNEAFPGDLDDRVSANTLIQSELSDWYMEARGARKVMLYSRSGWEHADSVGSPRLPEGRYVAGVLRGRAGPIRVLGIVPPYHAWRTQERWNERRRTVWQGNEDYWRALRADVLPHVRAPALVVGDFNVQLPPLTYPRPGSTAHRLCEAALTGWEIATAGIAVDGELLDKPLVCHAAHTPDFTVTNRFILSRFDEDGTELSDHPCICLTLQF